MLGNCSNVLTVSQEHENQRAGKNNWFTMVDGQMLLMIDIVSINRHGP